jgi:hypothetical protein
MGVHCSTYLANRLFRRTPAFFDQCTTADGMHGSEQIPQSVRRDEEYKLAA